MHAVWECTQVVGGGRVLEVQGRKQLMAWARVEGQIDHRVSVWELLVQGKAL